MILNDQELVNANAALGDLYRALATLRREYAENHISTFALLSEGPLHEVNRIKDEIDAYSGALLAVEQQIPLWLKLVGQKARWGETPSSIVTAFLDALRKGIQSIATFDVSDRIAGRPSMEIQLACDFEVSLFRPGSFEIGVRLPEPEQGEMFRTEYSEAAREALKIFLVAASYVSSPDVVELEQAIPDAKRRRVVLRALKPLIPRRSAGVDFVELYGAATNEVAAIHLGPDAADVISKMLSESIDEKELSFVGEIREMDLDKRTFRLRNIENIREVRCIFNDDLLPTANELLGKRVRVIGKLKGLDSRIALVVSDIDKVEVRRITT